MRPTKDRLEEIRAVMARVDMWFCSDFIKELAKDMMAEIDALTEQVAQLTSKPIDYRSIKEERDRLREALEKIMPCLPSYLGQSETKENPCFRRIANEALAQAKE